MYYKVLYNEFEVQKKGEIKMNKTTKIVIAAVGIVAVIAVAVILLMNSKPKTNLEPIKNNEDLSALVDKIYDGLESEMPMVQTQEIDVTDSDMVQYETGINNANDIEYAVVSKPMMSSQAYSLVLVKVKDGVNANEIAKQMNENADLAKWICVSAEIAYSTSSGNVVCLVMSSERVAKPIYEKFKTLAGTTGKEYEKVEAEPELPPEMY